jgi:N-acetylgalactosamine-N,N'-diacetylbacillosaminyl-diphospho-undecaprenol 4-alpha-N-acetylgalactosaminyltransferase
LLLIAFLDPSEIINDRQNGLLVEDQNFEKIDSNHEFNAPRYYFVPVCKQNALASVQQFSLENIGAVVRIF